MYVHKFVLQNCTTLTLATKHTCTCPLQLTDLNKPLTLEKDQLLTESLTA